LSWWALRTFVVIGLEGKRVQKVQKVVILPPFGGSAACGSENHTTGLRPLEMHPYSPTGTSPEGGSLLSALLLFS
jgi:hypothetical protein